MYGMKLWKKEEEKKKRDQQRDLVSIYNADYEKNA